MVDKKPKFNSMKEKTKYDIDRQTEYNADKPHQQASDKLDKAFGYSRLKLGSGIDYDAPLTVRNSGFFGYKKPEDRPLKTENWDENPSGRRKKELQINETGSVDKYAKGGAVPDFAKGGSSLPRTKYKWGK